MEKIEVVAAIIKDENRVLATRRGYGDFKGFWEFPGGKMEEGESPQQALVREIKEELDIEVEINEIVDTVEYDYPSFHLTMHCYFCSFKSGNLVLKEHEACMWLTKDNMDDLNWLPADMGLIWKLKNIL